MLFEKKNQKKIKIMWMIIGALVILSMILLYAPALLVGSQ